MTWISLSDLFVDLEEVEREQKGEEGGEESELVEEEGRGRLVLLSRSRL